MSNNINCVNPMPPSYSGVTINITNPALNIPPEVRMTSGEYFPYGGMNYIPNVSYPYQGVNVSQDMPYLYQQVPQGVNVSPNTSYPYQQVPQGVNVSSNMSYPYQRVPQGVNVSPNTSYPYQQVPHGVNVSPNMSYPYQQVPQGINSINSTQYPYNTQILSDTSANSEGYNQFLSKEAVASVPINNDFARNNSYNAANSEPYVSKGTYLEPVHGDYNSGTQNINTTNIYQTLPAEKHELPNSYPQQYYINSYDNLSNSKPSQLNNPANLNPNDAVQTKDETEINTDTSQEIIAELDERYAAEKEQEKNSKKTKIVALTNEYIMSLENYLNNPNTDIRLMASKEILTRLDEDRDRYDDAALNALLNKMLQDPSKLVRIAAMSAFSSELASGNDYTVQLLSQIQQNPEADPEDVLEASQILLKRAATTEEKYIPVRNQQQPEAEEQ